MKYTLFIFRRDLRIYDNNALNYALTYCKNVIPIFIFTPEQISKANHYRSVNAVNFMMKSLDDLQKEISQRKSRMIFFYGDNIKVLSNICNVIDVENIVFNLDYTPYALQRDLLILSLCRKNKINCIIKEDYLLNKIGTYLNKTVPYKKFTSFKKNAEVIMVDKPTQIKYLNLHLLRNVKIRRQFQS